MHIWGVCAANFRGIWGVYAANLRSIWGVYAANLWCTGSRMRCRGVDIVLDCVGASLFEQTLKAIKTDGTCAKP